MGQIPCGNIILYTLRCWENKKSPSLLFVLSSCCVVGQEIDFTWIQISLGVGLEGTSLGEKRAELHRLGASRLLQTHSHCCWTKEYHLFCWSDGKILHLLRRFAALVLPCMQISLFGLHSEYSPLVQLNTPRTRRPERLSSRVCSPRFLGREAHSKGRDAATGSLLRLSHSSCILVCIHKTAREHMLARVFTIGLILLLCAGR